MINFVSGRLESGVVFKGWVDWNNFVLSKYSTGEEFAVSTYIDDKTLEMYRLVNRRVIKNVSI